MSAENPKQRPNSNSHVRSEPFAFAPEIKALALGAPALQAASSQAALAAIDAIENWLQANRALIDAGRAAIRNQQDAMLTTMREPLVAAQEGDRKAAALPGLAAPFDAYRRLAAAFVEAQQSALRAWSGTVR